MAGNPLEKQYLKLYIEHFQSGDMDTHIESQKVWVRDMGPVVEFNMGFIETYQDPKQVRAEWEGFVAVVDEEESLKVGRLVAAAERLLANHMPWGP